MQGVETTFARVRQVVSRRLGSATLVLRVDDTDQDVMSLEGIASLVWAVLEVPAPERRIIAALEPLAPTEVDVTARVREALELLEGASLVSTEAGDGEDCEAGGERSVGDAGGPLPVGSASGRVPTSQITSWFASVVAWRATGTTPEDPRGGSRSSWTLVRRDGSPPPSPV